MKTGIRVPARWMALMLFCAGITMAHADNVDTNSPEALRDRYAAARDRFAHNQFQRPVLVDSNETSSTVTGNVYAVLNSPFARAQAALMSANNWCDILFLHLNTKYCSASTVGQATMLDLRIGKKYDQPLEDAYHLFFTYRLAAKTPDYLLVRLNADSGPLDTRDYRIVLEAIPLENGGRTFLHLSYAYGYTFMGRIAMKTYFGTVGRNKVGFTVTGNRDGSPVYVGGMRGLVERNTMRYYLAIEAFLAASSGSSQALLDKRLRDWFAATERYPRQLHEVEQGEYLDMKQKEYRRQQADLH